MLQKQLLSLIWTLWFKLKLFDDFIRATPQLAGESLNRISLKYTFAASYLNITSGVMGCLYTPPLRPSGQTIGVCLWLKVHVTSIFIIIMVLIDFDYTSTFSSLHETNQTIQRSKCYSLREKNMDKLLHSPTGVRSGITEI